MKIYTKTGDKGDTGLYGGGRLPKHHLRVETYGTVDELNCQLGMTVAIAQRANFPTEWITYLQTIQRQLFDLGAELATTPGKQVKWHLTEESVESLERSIDRLTEQMPEQRTFILPGGTELAAHCHLARAIARRAERRVVELHAGMGQEKSTRQIRYLNRLSDFLFVLARYANFHAGHEDIPVL